MPPVFVEDVGAAVVVVVVAAVPVVVVVAVVVAAVIAVDGAVLAAVVLVVVEADVVVWPHAATANATHVAAPRAINVRTLCPPANQRRRHGAQISQAPWRNLTSLQVAATRAGNAIKSSRAVSRPQAPRFDWRRPEAPLSA